jgi:peroxiredoxin (alkyl hydroperoxide reductase subunit C)
MIKINEQVPDLDIEVYHKNEIHKHNLKDYRGKWLIMLFYPADFTFVCPTELEEAADMYDKFQELGAVIISLSTDTVFVHKAWHDTSEAIKKIKYPMGADPTGKICRAFGTYLEDEGVSLRGTFIINPEGRLVAMDIHDNSIGRSAVEILRKLQAAKFVSENDGKVCPASWKPGDDTLTPGLDLVGKI